MNENFNYVQSPNAGTLANKVMRRVYVKMLVAMLVTAATSMYVSSNEAILQLIFGNSFVTIGLVISQIAVVLVLSGRLNKLSITSATLLFYLYSVLTGVVFSSILLLYTATSVGMTFLITAGVFAAMSIYGYFTSNDLSRFGSIMFMALIGLIVCSLVNMFFKSSTMDWIISFAGVLIFIGLTAWDTQKIKNAAMYAPDGTSAEKLATIGALSLYLDFVNLFIYLLRFFGGSRDEGLRHKAVGLTSQASQGGFTDARAGHVGIRDDNAPLDCLNALCHGIQRKAQVFHVVEVRRGVDDPLHHRLGLPGQRNAPGFQFLRDDGHAGPFNVRGPRVGNAHGLSPCSSKI